MDEHLAGCSSLTTDGLLSQLDGLLWNHENSYLYEEKQVNEGESEGMSKELEKIREAVKAQVDYMLNPDEKKPDLPSMHLVLQTYTLLQMLDILDNINEKLAMVNISIQDVEQAVLALKKKEQEQKGMYFIDNGDCHGAQSLERLEPPKEQSPNMLHIQINRLDGSCPVQASGTIEDHSAFYFRGRHEQWQFVAGPKELNTNGLVKVQLKLTQDSRVFVLEGDDEERMYLDYDHVRRCLQTYAQQYVEWMKERERRINAL